MNRNLSEKERNKKERIFEKEGTALLQTIMQRFGAFRR